MDVSIFTGGRVHVRNSMVEGLNVRVLANVDRWKARKLIANIAHACCKKGATKSICTVLHEK